MRKLAVALLFLLTILIAVPSDSAAQGLPPPPCCDGEGGKSVDITEPGSMTAPQTEVQISTDLLRLWGTNRLEFVDRLSEALFPGKKIAFVFSLSRFVTEQSEDGGHASLPETERVVAVQETRFFRISRSRIHLEDLEAFDQFLLTDGEVYAKVAFVKSDAPSSTR